MSSFSIALAKQHITSTKQINYNKNQAVYNKKQNYPLVQTFSRNSNLACRIRRNYVN